MPNHGEEGPPPSSIHSRLNAGPLVTGAAIGNLRGLLPSSVAAIAVALLRYSLCLRLAVGGAGLANIVGSLELTLAVPANISLVAFVRFDELSCHDFTVDCDLGKTEAHVLLFHPVGIALNRANT